MEGIIPLYKPKGMTSHDCVFKLRKILKTKKVGHTGTLDPDVTGVLPMCIGRATKVAEYITDAGKTYEGEVTLGFSTTTEDASGEIIEKKEINRVIYREELMKVLEDLTGTITQTPPMYSAVKVNGIRLYEYARKGIEVDRPSRMVHIYSIDLLDERTSFEGHSITFRFRVSCSKGTYIRTLAVMIGEALGYPSHMSDLCRTKSASFSLSNCFTLEDIAQKVEEGKLDDILYPVETALSHLPKYSINDKIAEKVNNGAVLPIPETIDFQNDKGNLVVIESKEGKALAIYSPHPTKTGMMKPIKVLSSYT